MNSTIIITGICMLLLTGMPGADGKSPIRNQAGALLPGATFTLKCQVFESCDSESATTDTVSHKGDFITFSTSGMAYLYYRNQMDSLEYAIINNDSISFGDTPFRVSSAGNSCQLYQNEEEMNGDFNRVTYFLQRKDPAEYQAAQ